MLTASHRTLTNSYEQSRKHSSACEHADAANCPDSDTGTGTRTSVAITITLTGSNSNSSTSRSTGTADHHYGHSTYNYLDANTDADALYRLRADRDSYPDHSSNLDYACNRTPGSSPNASADADADRSTHSGDYEQPYCFVASGTCSNAVW